MTNVERVEILHAEIREKAKEYQKLLNILQFDPPVGTAELFRLKRNLITISREKSRLIEEFNDLTQ